MKKVALGLGILAILCMAWCYQLYHAPLLLQSDQSLLIKPGDNLSRLGEELSRQGWLPWPMSVFKVYSRMSSGRGHIQAGEYALVEGTTVPELFELLRRGEVIQRSITFPEGWTNQQWVEHIVGNDLIVNSDMLAIESELGPLRSLEGQLFPDTYAYTRDESAVSLLKRARQKMKAELSRVWNRRSDSVAVKSPEELVILASMIEKETGYEGDRGLISSVFSNRLRRGMKLQSDPTVIYGLQDFDGDLKRRHLRAQHDYNTYVIDALPAGPICNPGRLSLEAAAAPEASNYLYFVAKGDGRSQFSETLEQHNAAVVQYQKSGRVTDYRSAPPINR